MTIARTGPSMMLLAAGLAALAGGCGTAVHRGSFQRSSRVSGPFRLEVHNGSGDIVVQVGRPGSIHIRGRITADGGVFGASEEQVRRVQQNLPVRHIDDTIVLGPVFEDGISIDYEIAVPAGTYLVADTGSGDCVVHGLRAGLELETGSGDIRLDEVAGHVRATTGSGSIEGSAVAGSIDAHTGSGDVILSLAAPGDVHVRTGSGSAEVRGVAGALAIASGSGDIVAEGAPRGPWYVATSSGDVRVALPPSASFDLDVTTSRGEIHLGRPVHTVAQDQVDDDDHHIAGRVGRGGPRIVVSTSSGDVAVE